MIAARNLPISIRAYAVMLVALGSVGFAAGAGANLAYGLKHPEADPYRRAARKPLPVLPSDPEIDIVPVDIPAPDRPRDDVVAVRPAMPEEVGRLAGTSSTGWARDVGGSDIPLRPSGKAAAGGTIVGSVPKSPMVGGAPMYRTRNIVENAVNSKDHTTLAAAVRAAGLVETLAGPGPFTVFAPTDAAFAKLPVGTVETLVKPENKSTLTKILTYHVVPGIYTSKDLMALTKKEGGQTELITAEGSKLSVISKGGKLYVAGSKGGSAALITTSNVMQSNGIVHAIDKVEMP